MSLQILCCCYAHDLSCALAATLIKLHIYIYYIHTLATSETLWGCRAAGGCDNDIFYFLRCWFGTCIFLRILANKSGATRLINDQQWNCMCSLCSGATMQATTCGARCQKCMQSEGMESHSLFCFEWSHDMKHWLTTCLILICEFCCSNTTCSLIETKKWNPTLKPSPHCIEISYSLCYVCLQVKIKKENPSSHVSQKMVIFPAIKWWIFPLICKRLPGQVNPVKSH